MAAWRRNHLLRRPVVCSVLGLKYCTKRNPVKAVNTMSKHHDDVFHYLFIIMTRVSTDILSLFGHVACRIANTCTIPTVLLQCGSCVWRIYVSEKFPKQTGGNIKRLFCRNSGENTIALDKTVKNSSRLFRVRLIVLTLINYRGVYIS